MALPGVAFDVARAAYKLFAARPFALSDTVDQENIGAQLEDGVLTLTLPKVAEAKPRRIALT